ncbi:proline-specific peptidase [Ramaria rubella]|nr:proline-specific peptidase [Ramaria rubella]
MSSPQTIESTVDFPIPAAGKPCRTWYKLVGTLPSQRRPLVALHGGPGGCHDLFNPLIALAHTHSIPLLLYDQIGGGRSTKLPEKMGDGTFWTDVLFMDELDNLLQHLGIADDYDLIGHSWGGMLASRFAARNPRGLKHLIVSDSPASMELWVKTAERLKKGLPQDVQDVLAKHEAAGTTHEKEYEGAAMVFLNKHACRLPEWPEEIATMFGFIAEDPTVYHTMNGPSEFHITGTLKTFTLIPDLPNITVPTLLINGHYDEAQDEVMEPFFRLIPQCRWVKFAESSHVPMFEEREKYLKVVADFVTDADSKAQ